MNDTLTGETVELLRQMIRNQCVNDGTVASGHEARTSDLLRSYLEGSGLDIDVYEPDGAPGRASLVTRIEGKSPDDLIYSLSSGARGQAVDVFGLGRWKELLDILAPYGITEEGGWCPVPPERKDWLSRTQQQEDAMAAQSADAMEPHRASLPKGAHVRVILPVRGKSRGKRRRKQGGRNT